MKVFAKIIAGILLLFNGIGALYGGMNLIVYSTGNSLGLSVSLLKYTPFNDYLIPGIILILVNGLASIFVLSAMLSDLKNTANLVMLQGALLTSWIFTEMLLIRTANIMHGVLGIVGITLIIIGYLESPAARRKEGLQRRKERRMQEVEQ
jgi:hypothetical protein